MSTAGAQGAPVCPEVQSPGWDWKRKGREDSAGVNQCLQQPPGDCISPEQWGKCWASAGTSPLCMWTVLEEGWPARRLL
jgi:hypothetical protein